MAAPFQGESSGELEAPERRDSCIRAATTRRLLVLNDAARWYDNCTHFWSTWTAADLVTAKDGATISVVLPARNEEATVGDVVGAIRAALVDAVPLVDEIVVMDSDSCDRTARVAADAGARVVACSDVVPELGVRPGKGEALWKSLFVTGGDLLVFIDADLVDVGSHYVTGLLGPLLTQPHVALVKAFYDRPLMTADGVSPHGGGRVTELVARPLLNLLWPDLAGLIQPLSGEYAGRRAALERLPFACGYGVEIGMVIDLIRGYGIDVLAQVDLGDRVHRHQTDTALGVMAAEILATALRRLPHAPALHLDTGLTQYRRDLDGLQAVVRDVPGWERPPAVDIPAYLARGGAPRVPEGGMA
jgi:glucosyl-3-phosphoglycerate synthase